MNSVNNALTYVTILVLAGCSSMPEVTVHYFHPRVDVEVTVTQTATCTSGKKGVLVTDVTAKPTYSADTARLPTPSVNLNELGSGLTKADASFGFYPDGRLKSVNSTQTGTASVTLGSIVSLAEATGTASTIGDEQVSTACQIIIDAVGAGKTLVIVSKSQVSFDSTPSDFKQFSVSAKDYEDLQAIFGTISIESSAPKPAKSRHVVKSVPGESIELIEPARGSIAVTVRRGKQSLNFSEDFLVPQNGTPYGMPIQKAPWFGQNVFELVLSKSGAVEKLRYSGGGSTDSALAIVNDVAKKTGSDSVADKIADAEIQADLIYQQNRLAICKADPANCPK